MKQDNTFRGASSRINCRRFSASKTFAQSAEDEPVPAIHGGARAGRRDRINSRNTCSGWRSSTRRSPSYDPRVDPIVRVEARRLRSKLKSYYDERRRRRPVVIEFPKGTYAPRSAERPRAGRIRRKRCASIPASDCGAAVLESQRRAGHRVLQRRSDRGADSRADEDRRSDGRGLELGRPAQRTALRRA